MILKEIFGMAKGYHARRMKMGIWYKILEMFCAAVPYGVIYLAMQMVFDPDPLGRTNLDTSKILMLTGVTGAALAGQFCFGVLGSRAAFVSGYGMFCNFRIDLLTHMSRLPLGFFQDKQVGALTANIAENVKMVEDIFTKVLAEMVAAFTLPAFIGLILLVVDWRMGLAAILSVPLAMGVLKVSQTYFTTLSRDRITSQETASGLLLEYIDGIRVIRNFGLSGDKFFALKQGLAEQRRLSVKLEVLGSMAIMCFAVILELGFISLLAVGAYAMLGGEISGATYVMGMVLSQKFFAPIARAVFLLVDIKYLGLAMENIKAVMAQPRLPEPDVSALPESMDITLDKVTFRYGKEETPALNQVSMRLKAGQTTALVGPSGAGKTTVAHLIARFHDVTGGRICIGGIDIRDISFEDLMERVSMVLQDVYLFNDTVAANIRLGDPDATDEAVIEAARHALCHDFILSLPQGYQTRVGEGGTRLSGGQKQRISIARALLKDAPIILLDESTAAIDPENEADFRKALAKLSRGKTVLIIAHRLNTISTSDAIVVMDKGKVIQTGTHASLLKTQGIYRTLWQTHCQALPADPPPDTIP